MSDPKSSYGEPVEEPNGVDDVVGRANEGLADAEAARGDAVAADAAPAEAPISADRSDEDVVSDQTAASDEHTPVVTDEAAARRAAEPADVATDEVVAPATAAPADPEPDPWASPEAASLEYTSTAAPVAPVAADDAPTVVAAPVVTPSEPVVAEPAVVAAEPAVVAAAAAPQPIFVQAPEAPRPRGNRAAAGAIGLLAALAFAVLYLAVWLGVGAIEGEVTGENVGTTVLGALATWSLWVPVVVFFIAFWLLGAIINRGRWGAWVILGILVGIAAYGGHILGALFQAPFWELTASEGGDLA
ncbi:hypothetical protein B1729_15995, partial [Microbacterium sp. B35-04]|uniref:ABC transporter n=1 Tax=Microbacterium sp. B35-04 TaxID=1961716 RepID=UPI0013D5BCA4